MRHRLLSCSLLGTVVLTSLLVAQKDDTVRPSRLHPVAAEGQVRHVESPTPTTWVRTEAQFRRAWTDPRRTRIDLGANLYLRDCRLGDPIRESPYGLVLDGHGHTIQQTCFEKRLLRQDGTGLLDLRHIALTRGGSDGPGAAVTSRGEIVIYDAVIKQNLAEEPGGGVFSMRRITVRHALINGNLANDDGGGLYARRGGVQVYDSVLSNNLVDGSGGAIGSTGDILVVRSHVDGNTTDGDGGALYADEDGDVVVIDSHVDGSDADGPGGAIFTLDGDVAAYNSTLNGNRADDRGGAISGEADVLLVNTTVARNLAVAHAGGGIWARGNLVPVNSTVTNNYAEGEGGGTLSAGRTYLIGSTLTRNIASVGGDVGAAGRLTSFATIIGPPATEGVTGDTIPTRRACRVYTADSDGYNFLFDQTCALVADTDLNGDDPMLDQLESDPNGFVLQPVEDSPVRGRIPSGHCLGALPDPLPAGQLLAPYVDWDQVLAHDAIGRPRDTGAPCDIGAVQTLDTPHADRSHPLRQPPGPLTDFDDLEPVSARAVATGTATLFAPPVRAARQAQEGDSRPGPLASWVRRIDGLSDRLHALSRESRRFDVLLGCIKGVGVDQVGDVRHRWGYLYDERDGTGLDLRPALALHAGGGQPELRLLALGTARRCLSAAPDPNGTGADPRPAVPAGTTGPTEIGRRQRQPVTVAGLLRRLDYLERLEIRVERKADRFDEWESCLSWVPVTEAGDAPQDLGFLNLGGADPTARRHLPALDVDASEWDDPDYELLAFVGRNRPFTGVECATEPGEDVDRPIAPTGTGTRPAGQTTRLAPAARPDRLDDLQSAVHALREDLEDLAEPVEEITQFDECMYTIGVRSRSAYLFQNRDGTRDLRSALSFQLRQYGLPDLSLLAFSGEEPPQIECNEDAAGQSTDE